MIIVSLYNDVIFVYIVFHVDPAYGLPNTINVCVKLRTRRSLKLVLRDHAETAVTHTHPRGGIETDRADMCHGEMWRVLSRRQGRGSTDANTEINAALNTFTSTINYRITQSPTDEIASQTLQFRTQVFFVYRQ